MNNHFQYKGCFRTYGIQDSRDAHMGIVADRGAASGAGDPDNRVSGKFLGPGQTRGKAVSQYNVDKQYNGCAQQSYDKDDIFKPAQTFIKLFQHKSMWLLQSHRNRA